MLIYQSKEEVDVTKNIFSGLIQHFQHTYEYAEVTFGFMPKRTSKVQYLHQIHSQLLLLLKLTMLSLISPRLLYAASIAAISVRREGFIRRLIICTGFED